MEIQLPDQSIVRLDCQTLRFTAVTDENQQSNETELSSAPFGIDCERLASFLSNPTWRFGDCFRRTGGDRFYSPIGSKHKFDIFLLSNIYHFKTTSHGVMFSSSTKTIEFLDGGTLSHAGYGFGEQSWEAVEGFEALRAICLFWGIKQPRYLKGEGNRRRLAYLLEDLSSAPLRLIRGAIFTAPEWMVRPH